MELAPNDRGTRPRNRRSRRKRRGPVANQSHEPSAADCNDPNYAHRAATTDTDYDTACTSDTTDNDNADANDHENEDQDSACEHGIRRADFWASTPTGVSAAVSCPIWARLMDSLDRQLFLSICCQKQQQRFRQTDSHSNTSHSSFSTPFQYAQFPLNPSPIPNLSSSRNVAAHCNQCYSHLIGSPSQEGFILAPRPQIASARRRTEWARNATSNSSSSSDHDQSANSSTTRPSLNLTHSHASEPDEAQGFVQTQDDENLGRGHFRAVRVTR